MIPFPKDFQDFLKLLHKHNVRYLIIGGYALGYHGYVRATGDMDIFIEVSGDNASHLVDAFTEFGFKGVDRNIFLDKGKMLRVGRPPMRLEILMDISGVNFDECYEACIKDELDGIPVYFIDRELLIKNKSSTGRKKDEADIEALEDMES